MLLKILNHIPIINSIVYFPWRTHKKAVRKLFILWIISTSPVFVSILGSHVPPGSGSFFYKFLEKVASSIDDSEQFVYAASFLSPFIFIGFSRLFELDGSDYSFARKVKTVRSQVFHGYSLILFVSIIVLIFTALSFSAARSGGGVFDGTFLTIMAGKLSLGIYFCSVFCWYLSILDDEYQASGVFQDSGHSATVLRDGLARRVGSAGEHNS